MCANMVLPSENMVGIILRLLSKAIILIYMYKSRNMNKTINLSVWFNFHITKALSDYKNCEE